MNFQKSFLAISKVLIKNFTDGSYGVTSSGKTEVYVKLMKETLAQHQQGIVFIPEMALPTQTYCSLTRLFLEKK